MNITRRRSTDGVYGGGDCIPISRRHGGHSEQSVSTGRAIMEHHNSDDVHNPEAMELLKSNPDEFFRITRGILHKPITMSAVCKCIVELTPDTVELSWETEYTVAIIAPCLAHTLVFQPTWWSRLLDKLTATNDLCYHVIIPAYGGRGVERVELGCSHSTSHHTNKVRGCSRCGCSKVFYSPMAT